MLAAVLTAPHQLAIRTLPAPERGRDAVVAVERIGICGTDLSILKGKIGVAYPRVLGHEMVGRVVSRDERGRVDEGTRVVVNPSVACGRCRQCRADRTNLCPNGALMGRDVDGGFTELVSVDEDQLLPIPDAYPSEAASLLQVLGTCVHAQSTVDVFPGQTAVVIGLGVSGLLMVQLLRARGLRVIGVTRAGWKRELAERLGATAVARPDDARGVVAEFTAGDGADVVVEAVGSVATLGQAVELAGFGAHVVAFGTIGASERGSLPFYDLYYKELTMHHPRAARHRDYQAGIDLATSATVDLAPLWTHGFPLARAADAFAALDRDPKALKVTLEI